MSEQESFSECVEIVPGKPGRLPFDRERVRPAWKYRVGSAAFTPAESAE
jgi:hypothetical protein